MEDEDTATAQPPGMRFFYATHLAERRPQQEYESFPWVPVAGHLAEDL
jgi:hypothetical protein